MPNVLVAHPPVKFHVLGGSTTEVVISSDPQAPAGSAIRALADDEQLVSVETGESFRNPQPVDAAGEATFRLKCIAEHCPVESRIVFHLAGYEDAICVVNCSKSGAPGQN